MLPAGRGAVNCSVTPIQAGGRDPDGGSALSNLLIFASVGFSLTPSVYNAGVSWWPRVSSQVIRLHTLKDNSTTSKHQRQKQQERGRGDKRVKRDCRVRPRGLQASR